MTTSRERFGIALGIAGVLLFGGTLPATRLAVVAFDPFFLSAARAAIAGCTGLALLLVLRRPIPPRASWLEFVLAGICTIIGFPVFMALAMAHVPASHGGVVLGIIPLATAAAAALVAHERPSAGFWLASIVGAAIVVVFMVRQSGANTIQFGDIYLLGTVLSGAFGYTLSGRLSRTRPGWEVISWQVASFLPLSLIAAYHSMAGVACRRAGIGLGRPHLCQLRQPVLCVFRLQRRDGHGRRGARRPIDAAAALRDRRPVDPGERRTFRIVDAALCGRRRRGGRRSASACRSRAASARQASSTAARAPGREMRQQEPRPRT